MLSGKWQAHRATSFAGETVVDFGLQGGQQMRWRVFSAEQDKPEALIERRIPRQVAKGGQGHGLQLHLTRVLNGR